MATQIRGEYADVFFDHFTTLRRYAERVFLDDETLTSEENTDKASRMDEFLQVGTACEFSERQLIGLLLAELF